MISITAIKNEILLDPVVIGYAPAYAAGDDFFVSNLFNTITGLGTAKMLHDSLARGVVIKGVIPATDQLASGLTISGIVITPALNAKWQNRFAALRAADDRIIIDTGFMFLLNGLVSDGLIQQPYIDALTMKTGSRAEVLFGTGTVISIAQVAATRGV